MCNYQNNITLNSNAKIKLIKAMKSDIIPNLVKASPAKIKSISSNYSSMSVTASTLPLSFSVSCF